MRPRRLHLALTVVAALSVGPAQAQEPPPEAPPPAPAPPAPAPEAPPPAPEAPPPAPAPAPVPAPVPAPAPAPVPAPAPAPAPKATPPAGVTAPAAPSVRPVTEPAAPAAAPPAAPPAAPDTPPGAAQPPEEGGEGREINRHRFFAPLEGQTAIIASSFAFRQGLGTTNAEVADGVGIQFYGYDQALRFQVGIKNRVAIDADLFGVANVGGTPETLAVAAALADLRAGGGVKVRLATLDSAGLQLAVGGSIYYVRNVGLVPKAWLEGVFAEAQRIAEEVQSSGAVPSEEELTRRLTAALTLDRAIQVSSGALVTPYAALTLGGGAFGLQASFAPAIFFYDDPAGESTTTVEPEIAAQLELDASRLSSSAPIALVGGYANQGQPGGSPQHRIAAGLFYAGRRSFVAGVSGSYAFQDLEVEGAEPTRLTRITGSMALQFYF